MILADEVVNNFLQYLYDEGYRYLFVVTYTGAAAVSKSKPTFSNGKCLESAAFYTVLSGYAHKLGRLILSDTYYCIDIGKKLNIIDWSTVEVDTKIRVRVDEDGIWRRRYFACYENKTVYAFEEGKTSWSAGECKFSDLVPWNFAEVVDE